MPSVVGTRRKDGQGLTEARSPRSRRHGAGSSGDSGCHRPWCRLPEEGRVSMHTDSLSPRRPQREQRLPRHLPPPPSPRRPPLPHADGSPGARSPEDSLGETPLTVCVCRGDARRGTGNRARAQAARLCGDRLPGRALRAECVRDRGQSERVHLQARIRQPHANGRLDEGTGPSPRAQGDRLKVSWGLSETHTWKTYSNPSGHKNAHPSQSRMQDRSAALLRKHPWPPLVPGRLCAEAPPSPGVSSQVLSKAVKPRAEENATLSCWRPAETRGKRCWLGVAWARKRSPSRTERAPAFPVQPGPQQPRAAPHFLGETSELVSSSRSSALAAGAVLASLLTFVSFRDVFVSLHFLPMWRTETPESRRVTLRPDFPFGRL